LNQHTSFKNVKTGFDALLDNILNIKLSEHVNEKWQLRLQVHQALGQEVVQKPIQCLLRIWLSEKLVCLLQSLVLSFFACIVTDKSDVLLVFRWSS
jgi:hypothetical protein